MANLFDVYNDGLSIDHAEGETLETGETPITISGLTADTTYDKVQVAFAGSYNKADVPSFKTNLGRNLLLGSQLLTTKVNPNGGIKIEVVPYDSKTNMWHITAPSGGSINAGMYVTQTNNVSDLITKGQPWAFSFDIKGTGVYSQFGIEASSPFNKVSGNVSTDWTRVSSTGIATGTSVVIIYFNTANVALDVYIKLPKIEIGNKATPWLPAPEDTMS